MYAKVMIPQLHSMTQAIKPGCWASACKLVLLMTMLCGRGYGAVFYVSDSSDTTNVTSLRGAIIAANAAEGYNIIYLAGGTYRLTLAGADENACYTGDLDIGKDDNLTIIGESNTVIDATGLGDRVIHVQPRAQLILYNMAITGGSTVNGTNGLSGGNGEDGGGIYNAGELTLNNCIVSNNATGAGGASTNSNYLGGNGGRGGGIFNAFLLAMNNSLVLSNATGAGGNGRAVQGNAGGYSQGGNGGDGAGLYNLYRMSVVDTSFTGNSNGGGGLLYGNGGNGGGLYNHGGGTLDGCVVGDNSAGADGVAGGSGGSGGGVYNTGTLTVKTCVVTGNSGGTGGTAQGTNSIGGGKGGAGGGFYNSGDLSLYNCTIGDNLSGTGASGGSAAGISYNSAIGMPGGSGGAGGGLYNTRSLILVGCTVSGNDSGTGGPGGSGRQGIFVAGAAGGAGGNGGGLYSSGTLTMKDCTISSNFCGNGNSGSAGFQMNGGAGGVGGNGGGLYNLGTFKVFACTISGNSSGSGGDGGKAAESLGGAGGNGGAGGGIFNATNKVSTQLGNVLIAQNLAGLGGDGTPPGTNGNGNDLAGSYTSEGFNLVGAGSGSSGLTNRIDSDLVGSNAAPINPLLGPLQDNGGPTFTQALLPHSPAIDKGKSFGLGVDQRGHRRVHNYASIPNATGGDGTDIGAFELDTPVITLKRQITGNVLSWEDNCPGYTLEFTTNLNSGNWIPLVGQFKVTHKTSAEQVFYRLSGN
jgi:hypothetical protein